MTNEEKVQRTREGVTFRAFRRFQEGRYDNPYPEHPVGKLQGVKYGMYLIYQTEMNKLLKEKECPCCGQPTMGDIAW